MSTNLDIDFLGRVTADPARGGLWPGPRACALLKPATPDHGLIRYAGCLPRGTAIAAGSRSPQRGLVVIRGVVCSCLDLETGQLRYLNAGHPAPLLLRDRRLVGPLRAGKRMPLGVPEIGDGVAEEVLQLGDRLLLYTDGVTEARAHDGSRFGTERLVCLAEDGERAGLPAPETLRRLALAVTRHQAGPPRDDATLMLMHWSRAAALRTVTGPPFPAPPREGEQD